MKAFLAKPPGSGSGRSKRMRKKRKRSPLRHTEILPHQASPKEVVERASSALAGFVCGACGWILIQSEGSRGRPCPKCRHLPMRRYSGRGLGDLAVRIQAAELSLENPIGDAAFVRARIAGAMERFNTRKDDWATATEMASEGSKKAPTRAKIAKVYRKVREARLDWPEPGRLPPTLEALEQERRQAERDRVKGIRKSKKAEGGRRKRPRR